MKRILITGAGSYIGTAVEKWLMKPEFIGMYQVDTIDMRGDEWRNIDFSIYDSIFHVAGIAHADIGKLAEKQKKQYYKVNCDLAFATAEKAKKEGVKQFIYMSSIIVYGEGTSIKQRRIITKDTMPSPSSFYGDSKWKAEQKLLPLNSKEFFITILRPPMIYGEGCKGNYKFLEKLALKIPLFPDFPNQRSILSIRNLCIFLQELFENEQSGIYFPQDEEYASTAEIVKNIAKNNHKKIWITPLLNWVVILAAKVPGRMGNMTNKAFGSLVYEKNIVNGKS